MLPEHPQRDDIRALAREIRRGRAVAFVGAGFMQPSTLSWRDLLARLTTRVQSEAAREDLQSWLGCDPEGRFIAGSPKLTSQEYEGVAQKLQGLLPDFAAHVNHALGDQLRDETVARLRLLGGIPFHLVLTTNFDRLMGRGLLPRAEHLGQLLRVPRRSWWSHEFWQGLGQWPETPTLTWHDADTGQGGAQWIPENRFVKLHGDLTRTEPQLVFGTAGYRRLTHLQPGYRAFLRALFATHTVVYMGFSFTDAYINELRAEVVAHFGVRRGVHDYAILSDVPKARAEHLREELSLVPLVFPSVVDGRQDFTGFDRLLGELHRRTNPAASLRHTIRGRRILWFDPSPENNTRGIELLREQGALGGATFDVEGALDAAVTRLTTSRAPEYDVVISHWGHQPDGVANAIQLLERLGPSRPPVIVFASPGHRHINRPAALRHGALAYTDRWGELFGTLDHLFADSGYAPSDA